MSALPPQKRTSMQVAFSAWSAQMLPRLAFASMTAMAMASSLGYAQAPSPNGVKTLNPPGAIKAEGTWSLGARAGDFVFVAGMQGVDPATNRLVQDPYARIRQAFLNTGSLRNRRAPACRIACG